MWLHIPASCLSAPATAGSTSLSNESGEALARSVTWRGKLRASRFWRRVWRTAPWIRLLSTATSSPSTLDAFVEQWISSWRDSRVSLISVTHAEVLRIPTVDHVDELPAWVPQGGRWLVGFCMNAGQSSPRLSLSSGLRKFREQGKGAYGWSEAHRARVARQLASIRHWRVIEGDYTSAPDVEATWFVDPPYQRSGVHYNHPSTALDFSALAEWCRSRRGQVIACEADGADWLPFRVFARPARSAMNRNKAATEMIWTSETSCTASQPSEAGR